MSDNQQDLEEHRLLEYETDVAMESWIPSLHRGFKSHCGLGVFLKTGFHCALLQHGETLDNIPDYQLPQGELESDVFHIFNRAVRYPWSQEFSALDRRRPSIQYAAQIFNDFEAHDAHDVYGRQCDHPDNSTSPSRRA